jgi:hypothetical protein
MSKQTILASIANISSNYLPKTDGTVYSNSLIYSTGVYTSIGTTATHGNLTIEQTTGESGLVINSSIAQSPKLYLRDAGSAGYSEIVTNNKLFINSSNVGIGTSSPIAYSGYTNLHISGATSTGSALLYLTNSTNSIVGLAYAEGTNSNVTFGSQTQHPVRFVSNDSERMRLTSVSTGGWLKVSNNGTYVNTAGNYHEINSNRNNDNIAYLAHSGSLPYGPFIYFYNASPNNTTNYFLLAEDSTNAKAIIYSNGTFGSRTGTYGSIISDIKYKQDITDANSQWDDIKKLRVVNFKYKEDVINDGENALRQIGFIAQEVESVSPNLVYEAGQKDTEETWKSVKTSIIHLKAVKALQEAMARIEQLEAKIDAQQETINTLLNK